MSRFFYITYAREVVNELVKRNDKDLLYKFIKQMCKYAKDTNKNFNIPNVNFEDREWIPIDKDNLPKCEVLCCDKYNELMFGYIFFDEGSDTQYSAENDNEYMYNCVAWKPKPKGYNKTK